MEQKSTKRTENFLDILSQMRDAMIAKKVIMTIEDVSTITGLSVKYIYQLTSKRLIPYCKTPGGNKLFFKHEEIIKWITAVEYKPKYEGSNLNLQVSYAKSSYDNKR